MTISSDAYGAWTDVAIAKQQWAETPEERPTDAAAVWTRYDAAVELWKTLRYEAAQLYLLAGPGVRRATSDLISVHEGMRYRLNPNRPGVTLFRTGEEKQI
jgi:hypothetical protein